MLNIGRLKNGIVLDHIAAGKAMEIYKLLDLGELDTEVAIIKNAHSNKMGRKDIIKIEDGHNKVDLDALGYIDCNITVDIIRDGKVAEKKDLTIPKVLINVIKCHNPRCITTVEPQLDQIFDLTNKEKHVYRCRYCEEKAKGSKD